MGFKFSAVVRVNWNTAGLALNTPLATYRIQLNREFGFCDMKRAVPYLAKLGVSHIYASPIFKARAGSLHGYDIVDPTTISEELGGKGAFEELKREAANHGLGWLQDIVPNHAAYSLENKRVYDLLQNGSDSRYCRFFDVNWNHPSPKLNGRILVPFLAKELAECINQKEIVLVHDGSFKIRYNNIEFPVNSRSTKELSRGDNVRKKVNQINKNPKRLEELLSKQFYTLMFWRDAFREINYRRFFDILDLIGLRMEEPDAFEETHKLIFDLLRAGKIDGLRVDHIDGLYNPDEYLQSLRQHAPKVYVIVEKILTDTENLPESWPIQGSTGYDFINQANGLFVKQSNEALIDGIYKRFTGNPQTFDESLFECKNRVIDDYFLGDISNLSRLILQTANKLGQKEFDPNQMPAAIATLVACFPVYRTYLTPKNPKDKKGYFQAALKQAKQRKPEYTKEVDAIESLLNQCTVNATVLETLMRLQQFTGAVMAKGLEDTTFYRYCRFLALNEVGGNPAKFGVSTDEFHKFNVLRQQQEPLTLNASSTHDTKRGEDVRARLNVLSEIPDELERHLYKWTEINVKHKTRINDELAPDRNEDYMIYQTILGSYPFEPSEVAEFTQRTAAYVAKALREAKTHTSWLNPNIKYENAAVQFTHQILTDHNFLEDFLPFQHQVANYGFFNTLSQTLLKITCPGVPDFYQGAELWNLSMVDPDNRRKVDYIKRERFLEEVSKVSSSGLKRLLEDFTSGKAKLYLIFKALQVRHKLKALFEEGTYVPLMVEGDLREHVFAFMRKKQGSFMVVVIPRFLVELLKTSGTWGVDWKDTTIKLPPDSPSTWKETFTGSNIHVSTTLSLSEVLEAFPVALLIGGTST
ncbi:MAG: malto-oligosyltrehalose synthase [Candidatus Bathyarchaeia archaeon]